MNQLPLYPSLLLVSIFSTWLGCNLVQAEDAELTRIRQAVTFYASFDEAVRGDYGKGSMEVSTRFDHPKKKGQYVFEKGFNTKVFRVVKGRGVSGGALQGRDVLPRRGRIFFPAKGNLPYKPTGWGGSVSFWLNTNPNTQLKTPFCDPIQITQKGASDGGLWIDFPKGTPRALRLGAFRALGKGEKPVPESARGTPLVRIKNIGFKVGDWHHIVFTWDHFDTGKNNAHATLYIDGKSVGGLKNRNIAMKWDLDHTGIYVAVNYIGLLDELAIFNRPLKHKEIQRLQRTPGWLSSLNKRGPKGAWLQLSSVSIVGK